MKLHVEKVGLAAFNSLHTAGESEVKLYREVQLRPDARSDKLSSRQWQTFEKSELKTQTGFIINLMPLSWTYYFPQYYSHHHKGVLRAAWKKDGDKRLNEMNFYQILKREECQQTLIRECTCTKGNTHSPWTYIHNIQKAQLTCIQCATVRAL